MMKKTVLALVCIIVTASAVYYSRISTSDKPMIQAASQLDTKVDTDSSRDTFEYFLSGLGEINLNTLKDNFESYNEEQASAYQLDEDLFQRFINYRAALEHIDSNAVDKLDIDALQRLIDQIKSIQLQFFTPQEQQLLFAEENQLRELALKQLEIQQHTQNAEETAIIWEQEIDQLSPDLQLSYRNANLLGQLQRTKEMTDQERYLANQELVGTEAANRLEKLAIDRAEFEETVNSYLQQRDEILANSLLTTEEQQSEVDNLRNKVFTEKQVRRVKALESIADQQRLSINRPI
ncbi:lipase secretion chaperone [Photobacterium alginatilyticum]|uniref:Lipase chaperone n=1 Tax=Photobacterium alginatilyticum TaxID=1775171 RepID=A0ABW9YH09_9GAMM|nr:lipase secretion chaperone [Photobacterium alginatilyticum]NBI53099.1 lipase chaperone [Photobacterium alginatilyticum]